MKKLLVMFILIGILAISGIAYAQEIISSETYFMGSTYAQSYQWTPILYIDLTSQTTGIAARSITVSWSTRGGVVEKVRLYKDNTYCEKVLTTLDGTTSVTFTESEVMGISYSHVWGVQFQVSHALYTYVWVDNISLKFVGPAVALSNPPVGR